MVIHYALYKNNVVVGATDFVARVLPVDSIDLERLAEIMVERGSTVTKADILAVQEDTVKTIEQMLKLGFRVNMGELCSFYTVIKGRFADIRDGYDPAIHRLDVGSTPGPRIRNFIRGSGMELEKEETPVTLPVINVYEDVASGELNSTLTVGSVGTVIGSNLKFEPTMPDEGVFLLTSGQPEVRATVIQKNTASQIVFQVPLGLLPGTMYQLEVRARFTDGGLLKKGELLDELETPT